MNDITQIEKQKRDFDRLMKAYAILRQEVKTCDTEIKDLVAYFASREEFEIAAKLQNLLL